ncbi:mannose-binding protein [Pectobacterium punjabense]|uniref:Mannose-binding protein n=2 Tax=Pectobacterium punjabense TaxID=2108399 RepID=A0ABX6L893_9GAMM|nr:fimbrial protein [Pectobacterium punjabense]PTA63999.1 mannose-binding protein [Pectobacterium punjabense]QJA22500.1 mannose-binding protein [Pectobacterium punjabense]
MTLLMKNNKSAPRSHVWWRGVTAAGLLGIASQASAVQCTTSSGSPLTYDYTYALASSQNYVGYVTGWNEKTDAGSYTISGPCNNRDTVYYSAQSGPSLVLASTESGVNWFNITGNDYLQVSSRIFVYNRTSGGTFHNVPFTDVNNNCAGLCGGNATTGSRVQVNFRIKRKFVGVSNIPMAPIFYLYGNQGGNGQSVGSPLVVGYMSGSVTVPQSCALNAGQIISIDFGGISSGLFNTAGEKPVGVSPVTRTIGIACNGIDAQASLSMRLQADRVSGDMVVSDNPDVGFIVTDSGSNPLTPNDIASVIPFTLDETASANVAITAYPVSVTGNKPQEGVATANAYLRVDFY